VASSSRGDIEREIKRLVLEADSEREIRLKGKAAVVEIMEFAKVISPLDEDDDNAEHYKNSFMIRAKTGRGKLPSWTLSNSDKLTTIMEFGSSDLREQGGSSPAHHTFTITAANFGGTPDGVGGHEDEEL
jgi:hypothetical protein